MLPKVDVIDKIVIDPSNPDKSATAALESVRSAAADLAKNNGLVGEALDRIAEDLKKVNEQRAEIETLKAHAKKQDEALKANEDIAKAAMESSRGGQGAGAEKIERMLKATPIMHRASTDPEFKDRGVSDAHWNLLHMRRHELEMFLPDSEAKAWVNRWRHLNDALVLLDVLHLADMRTRPDKAQDYISKGRYRQFKLWPQYEEASKFAARALDTATSGGVSDWVPTVPSSLLFEDIQHQLGAPSQFPAIDMPNNPWRFPNLTHSGVVYLIAESTGDTGNTITAVDAPTSGSFTLTAVKHARATFWSRESDQDSLVPMLPMFNRELVYKHAEGKSDAFINGQLALVIDTGSSPAATDVRSSWGYGLRRAAYAVSAAGYDMAGAVGTTVASNMIAALGKYASPQQCFFLTGYKGFAKALVATDASGANIYLTREKAGEMATAFSGALGILMGYPLVVDGFYPQNMNASGVIDNITTTKTGMLLVNREMFVAGQRQGLQLEVSDDIKFMEDLRAIRSTIRIAFQPKLTPSATITSAVAGVNL